MSAAAVVRIGSIDPTGYALRKARLLEKVLSPPVKLLLDKAYDWLDEVTREKSRNYTFTFDVAAEATDFTQADKITRMLAQYLDDETSRWTVIEADTHYADGRLRVVLEIEMKPDILWEALRWLERLNDESDAAREILSIEFNTTV